jgi:hypothetical protein
MTEDRQRPWLKRLVRQAFEELATTGHVAEGTVLGLALALRGVSPDEGLQVVTTLARQAAAPPAKHGHRGAPSEEETPTAVRPLAVPGKIGLGIARLTIPPCLPAIFERLEPAWAADARRFPVHTASVVPVGGEWKATACYSGRAHHQHQHPA